MTRICFRFFLGMWSLILPVSVLAQGTPQIPDAVLDITDEKCAISGCHAGPAASEDLDLREEFFLASVLNVPSSDNPEILRVKPGDPVNSYLMMKIRGAPGIIGERMPRGSDGLSNREIQTLAAWIASLPPSETRVAEPEPEFAQAFPGVSVATLPNTEMIPPSMFLFRIAHRWRGPVSDGFGQFFGLDSGALIFLEFGFPITNNLMFTIARSNQNATFELSGKWRFLREKTDGSVPISAALRAGVDWETLNELPDPDDPTLILDRSDGERFHWFVQLPLSKRLGKRVSVLFTPAVLFNPSVAVKGEDPLVTLGFSGSVAFMKDFALFVEGIPIVAGAENANVVGSIFPDENGKLIFYDAWTVGLQRRVGGHVFHVYISNSLGLATNEYMSGGDLDFKILDGNFRLGFNIYRNLNFPF